MRKFILGSGAPTKEFPVSSGITIGSGGENAIQINGPKVKKLHAKVSIVGGHLFIEDAESQRDLIVNGKVTARWALKKGDEVSIGETVLRYEEDDKPEPAAPSKATPIPTGSPVKGNTAVLRQTSARIQPAAPSAKDAGPGPGVSGRRPASGMPTNPASVGPAPSASGRRPALTGEASKAPRAGSSSTSAVLQAANAVSSRKPYAQRVALDKQTIWIFRGTMIAVALIFLAFLAWIGYPYIQGWRERSSANWEATREEREALERLRKPEPKDPKDLQILSARILNAKSWYTVQDMLGEPDLQFQEKILLYNPRLGSQEEQGHEFKAYYQLDPQIPNPATNYVAPIILFRVEADGKVVYRGPQMFARVAMPPPKSDEILSPEGVLPSNSGVPAAPPEIALPAEPTGAPPGMPGGKAPGLDHGPDNPPPMPSEWQKKGVPLEQSPLLTPPQAPPREREPK